MKIRILLVVGVVFLLTSCGGGKKYSRSIKKKSGQTSHKNHPKLGTNIPSIEELPNPLEQNIPHFESDVSRYIYMYKAIAMEEMGTYGIPASITLAQGILESGSGKSELARKSNNHFGIKCHDWKGDRVYHDDDLLQECFRKYKNPNYSFRDHSLFLKHRSRYGKLFELPIDDYKGWSYGLKAAGYATDPSYPKKLIGIIERYDLHQYDEKVLEKLNRGQEEQTEEQLADVDNQPSNTQTYIVQKGDTLYSISKKFGLSVESLKKQNNLSENNIAIGQELIVSN
ncbi:MAG TPA: glucosaminidase domain-containing protein [Flavobacteriaceae bacterium]|nr:glucosaminidase domain-containing protein [Flavobacteriaceae bacterium]